MKKYLLGVDGGGSKTAFLLTDINGAVLSGAELGGSSLPHIGARQFTEILLSGIERVASEANADLQDIASAAFGMPCFGESEETDRQMIRLINDLTPCANVGVYNDVEVAHAGSLALAPGIHAVAGTGAIVMGKNAEGATARANGWHDTFSDEGSGYWLGLKTLSVFAKQSDFRYGRGPLYHLVREHFNLKDDLNIVPRFEDGLKDRRDRIAGLQLILLKAAEAGDRCAIDLYAEAAEELFISVLGVYRALGFEPGAGVTCSYSGGMFNVKKYVLAPFGDKLSASDIRLAAPVLDPVRGAVLTAARDCGMTDFKAITDNLRAWKKV